MSDIIEKLQSRYTGMQSLMTGKQLSVVSQTHASPTHREMRGVCEEYEMRVNVGTFFRCNPDMLEYAEENARRMIARELYKDVYHSLDRIRQIAYTFDTSTALLEELDKLEECIR